MKPANIQVLPGGEVKILDFGIAKVESLDLTQTGMMIGTPGYASPEQARGLPVTPASDVFSFGVVFYELLTGRRPFEADTPMALLFKNVYEAAAPFVQQDAVPAELQELVMGRLAKDPAERFATLAPVVQRLRPLHKALALDANPETGAWLPGGVEIRPLTEELYARVLGPAQAGGEGTAGAPTPPGTPAGPTLELLAPLAPALGAPPGVLAFAPVSPPSVAGSAAPASAAAPATAAAAASGSPTGVPGALPETAFQPATPAAPIASKFLGAPTAVELERAVKGEMARTEFEVFNAEVRRVARAPGHVNTLGRSFEWNHVDLDGTRLFSVSIAPRAGFTAVPGRGELPAGRALAVWRGPGRGRRHRPGHRDDDRNGDAALPADRLVPVGLVPSPGLPAGAVLYAARVRGRIQALQQLLDRLSEHVERTALPPGTPGNAPYRPSRSRARG